MKRFAVWAMLAAVPFFEMASASETSVEAAVAQMTLAKCEAALAGNGSNVEAECAAAVAWKLNPGKTRRVRPILVLRNSLIA